MSKQVGEDFDMNSIRPMPASIGYGFTSMQPLDESLVAGYRYKQEGRYHNYFYTPSNTDWPVEYPDRYNYVIDGFSPNLNKSLHVGHLRNLALAVGLRGTLLGAKFVSMLGASLGVKNAALEELAMWQKFLFFKPEIYYDVVLPDDLVQTRFPTPEEIETNEKFLPDAEGRYPYLWDGPHGPVIVKRPDGTKLYAYHDLCFAMKSGVTHYITGHEQKDHFKQLGFEKKHLPMGLVLGPDGKKMKSRDGNAFLASEAMQMVIDQLKEESEASLKIAWNIIAWNFLHVSRTQDIKFEPQKWTRPESPGMYITYTYARIWSAFREVNLSDEKPPLRQKDADLLGYANQYVYWRRRDGLALDPTSLANFAHSLAIVLNQRYQSEKIIGGDYSFVYAMNEAYNILGLCMLSLGMFLVNRV